MKKTIIIIFHAFTGWVHCGVAMGICMKLMPMDAALLVHAAAAPLIFMAVSMVYFKKFSYTGPLLTAVIFVSFVMLVDFFVVALLIEKSMEMFTSIIGTWMVFLLIFLSVFSTGKYIKRS
jgi:hypothetical protein